MFSSGVLNYTVLAKTFTDDSLDGTTINGNLGYDSFSKPGGYPDPVVSGTTTSGVSLAPINALINDLSGCPCNHNLFYNTTPISNGTYTPGTWCITTSPYFGFIYNQTLVFDAQGDSSAVFVLLFDTVNLLTIDFNTNITLLNGAQPCNIFWVANNSIFGFHDYEKLYGVFIGGVFVYGHDVNITGKILSYGVYQTADVRVVVNSCSCQKNPISYSACEQRSEKKTIVYNFKCSNGQDCYNGNVT
jgi:hypothetical protein